MIIHVVNTTPLALIQTSSSNLQSNARESAWNCS